MQWWMRPGHEALLGDQEPLPLLAQQGIGAEAHALVEDLRVPAEHAEARLGMLHRRHVADDRHPRRVDRHDEHRRAPVRRRVRVGDGHDDEEVGDRAVRGEPLVPVEHVAVAVADRTARELRRVRAGRGGLGHRERRAELPGEQRLQPALLLLGSAGEGEDLAVARVGRLAAEHRRGVDRRAEDLVHQPELDLAEALAAELGREVRGPQPALLDRRLQRGVDAIELDLREAVLDGLDRPDLVADERPHPLEVALELGVGGEVPGHSGSFVAGRGRMAADLSMAC